MANDEYRFVLPYERSGKEYSGYETVFSPNDVAILSRLRERTFYESQFEKIRVKTKLRTFGEASCFWLSLCYEEYATNAIHDILRLYRRLLQGRRVLFVAPDHPLAGPSFRELCRQGVITSPRSVDFLSIPESDCFDYYGDIRKKVTSFPDVDAVFIQGGRLRRGVVEYLTRKGISRSRVLFLTFSSRPGEEGDGGVQTVR